MPTELFSLFLARPLKLAEEHICLTKLSFKRPLVVYFKIAKNSPWLIGAVYHIEKPYLEKLKSTIVKHWLYDRENIVNTHFSKNDADYIFLRTGWLTSGEKSIWFQHPSVESVFAKPKLPTCSNILGLEIKTSDISEAQKWGGLSYPLFAKTDYDLPISQDLKVDDQIGANLKAYLEIFKEDSILFQIKAGSKGNLSIVVGWFLRVFGSNSVLPVIDTTLETACFIVRPLYPYLEIEFELFLKKDGETWEARLLGTESANSSSEFGEFIEHFLEHPTFLDSRQSWVLFLVKHFNYFNKVASHDQA